MMDQLIAIPDSIVAKQQLVIDWLKKTGRYRLGEDKIEVEREIAELMEAMDGVYLEDSEKVDLENKIDDLNDEKDDLEERSNNLSDENGRLEDEKSNLQSQISNREDEIKDLKGEIKDFENDIRDLKI